MASRKAVSNTTIKKVNKDTTTSSLKKNSVVEQQELVLVSNELVERIETKPVVEENTKTSRKTTRKKTIKEVKPEEEVIIKEEPIIEEKEEPIVEENVEVNEVIEKDSNKNKNDKKKTARKEKVKKVEKKKKEKHRKKGQEIVRVNTAKGLSSKMVEERVRHGLVNKTKQKRTKSVSKIIINNIFTIFNLLNILMFAWLISVGSYQNCLFMVIIAINTVIGITQEIKAKKTIDSLSLVNSPSVDVLRNGKLGRIRSDEVVLDDIVFYQTGKQICADSTVKKGMVEVNEAMLTGESEVVVKRAGSQLFAGSYVVSGECYARVEHVGKDNYIEKLSSQAKKYIKPKSDIMRSLNILIKIISCTVIIMAFAVFYFNFDAAKEKFPDDLTAAYNAAVVHTSGSVIGMIPSGLFLMTSISLAFGVIKLAKHRTVVQDMYCIEMLARVDVMCLDKTGTITDGTMKVKEVMELSEDLPLSIKQIIAIFNGNFKDNSPTSIALQKRFGSNKKLHYRHSIPFSSVRKYSAIYMDDLSRSFILGAPEFILKERYAEIEYDVYKYSKLGYRVMLLASSDDKCKDHDTVFTNITPLALIAIEDTIRKDAIETIDYFKKSGVMVKVISGDNPVTVSKIAKRAGIEDADHYISLEDRGEDDLEDLVENYTVFGRVSPNQKKAIISLLKEKGHTVAMTGDGVNDILALKEADCSIAMANGSDAVRSVSHLVLLDSTFSSMPKVVMEGRRVVNNIKRVSTIYLTKTIFSFLLSVLFIALNYIKPTTYPLEPIYLLPFDWFVITIPSFYLAIEQNNTRIKGKFLSDVLLNALPGAVLIVVNYLVISLAGPQILGLSDAMVTSATVYSILIVGIIILSNVFKPFSLKRGVVFTLNLLLLIGIIIVAPHVTLATGIKLSTYFGLHELNVESVMLLIIIAQYSYVLLKYLNKLLNNFTSLMKSLRVDQNNN